MLILQYFSENLYWIWTLWSSTRLFKILYCFYQHYETWQLASLHCKYKAGDMCESFTVAIWLLLMYDVNDLTITMNTRALGSSCLTWFPPTTGIYLPLDVSGALSKYIMIQHWSCGLPVENSMCNNQKMKPLNYRDSSYVVMKLQFNRTSLQGEKNSFLHPQISDSSSTLKCI